MTIPDQRTGTLVAGRRWIMVPESAQTYRCAVPMTTVTTAPAPPVEIPLLVGIPFTRPLLFSQNVFGLVVAGLVGRPRVLAANGQVYRSGG